MESREATVVNLDCTIFCSDVRIVPVAEEMRRNIAAGLGVPAELINVKGKTNDGFGPEGRGEAISATVVVQVETRGLRGKT